MRTVSLPQRIAVLAFIAFSQFAAFMVGRGYQNQHPNALWGMTDRGGQTKHQQALLRLYDHSERFGETLNNEFGNEEDLRVQGRELLHDIGEACDEIRRTVRNK